MKTKELVYLLKEQLQTSTFKTLDAKPFIAKAYNLVIKHINDTFSSEQVLTPADIDTLQITEHMREKLNKLLKKKISANSSITKKILINELEKITGIGHAKALELIDIGIKNIDQLHQIKYQKVLNLDTKTILKLNPSRHIPHAILQKLQPSLTGFKDAETIMVGSFRRNAQYSNDIDIMVVSRDKKILDKYIDYLKEVILSIWVYSKGNDKISLVLCFSKNPYICYKADIFRTEPEYKHSMLLYSTGSKSFNIRQRSQAKKMGYLLNQKGIWKNGQKINMMADTEQDLFRILGMPYIEPKDRK